MKSVFTTGQYRKDLKKYRYDTKKLRELYAVIEKLRNEEPLSANLKKHALHGDYEGCLECHIGGDFLLIWLEDDNILLIRLGTHHELFGK